MGTIQKKILVADDDPDDREFLMEIISQIDGSFKIDTVVNGQQVLQYLDQCEQSDLPCLIILDYKMPFLNGAEVLEKMKAGTLYAAIPKVVWSTSTDKELVNRCIRAGAVNYFPKPSKTSEMKVIARQMLDICN
jgi:CheY-like chemotaxis protein